VLSVIDVENRKSNALMQWEDNVFCTWAVYDFLTCQGKDVDCSLDPTAVRRSA
jgi:hypothetical protein